MIVPELTLFWYCAGAIRGRRNYDDVSVRDPLSAKSSLRTSYTAPSVVVTCRNCESGIVAATVRIVPAGRRQARGEASEWSIAVSAECSRYVTPGSMADLVRMVAGLRRTTLPGAAMRAHSGFRLGLDIPADGVAGSCEYLG
jgi:hypothetical protein